MVSLMLVLTLAAAVPAAAREEAADRPFGLARDCPAGTPKARKYDEATFTTALAALRKRTDVIPRAWAVTCGSVVLCSQRPWGDSCPRIHGQSGPQGASVGAGELLVLVDFVPEKERGALPYALRAKDMGKKWSFSNGWILPSHRIAVVEGPAFGD
jgi:hypothetical protein